MDPRIARAKQRVRHQVGTTRARMVGRLEAQPWWSAVPARRLKDLAHPDLAVESVALTFDDGPNPEVTPGILRTLADHDARATFFMCGKPADRHPDLVRAVAGEGHVVAGHTWEHYDLRTLADDVWAREVDSANDLLEQLTQRPVRYFRPPHGKHDRRSLRWLAQRDLLTVVWSSHGADWAERSADGIARRVITSVRPGSIVLLHDDWGDRFRSDGWLPAGSHGDRSFTLAALPQILGYLRAVGLSAVALPREPAPGIVRPSQFNLLRNVRPSSAVAPTVGAQ